MNNIIRTYFDRKLAGLETAKDEAIIAVKVTDPNYATLRNLKKTNDKCEGLISLGAFVFSDSIKEQINAIRKDHKEKIKELTTLVEEADAMFDMADDYAEQVKVLKSYGILKKNGTINA